MRESFIEKNQQISNRHFFIRCIFSFLIKKKILLKFKNSLFQTKISEIRKKIRIQNYLLEKDLQISIRHFL